MGRFAERWPLALFTFAMSLVGLRPAVAADAGEQSLAELVRTILLENLPQEIAGENDWGQQREVASGLRFERQNGRLRVEKRTKEVNDGLWTNYRVTLVDPNQNLHVQIAGLRRMGPGRLAFQLFLSAKLDGVARYERWRRGVKMLNFKVDAGSTIEAQLDCEVALHIVPSKFLGDLVVEPKVLGVKLALADIDLARVSRVDGRAAEELGDRLRHALDKELRSRQDHVAAKLNDAARAHPERLRFSSDRLLAAGMATAADLVRAYRQPVTTPATP
ncbi:MAG: hypothetical protein ABUL64_03520 [Singulisphaera sp.]